ncbi:hypothetical protein KGM_215833 [Danaus plexippus plexippus]|uniref:Uncharacterized protein n=1 Tax=Danaus plexippus plexippus TaxID=278856 RepID=A0A212ESX2_DANPL|nr:hypothetical protein KGM_215833 [Danaus plexippus plexippus]
MKLFKRRLSFAGDKHGRASHSDDPFEHEDKARFSDTSWQIHRTWSRNGDPLRLSPPPMRQDTTISSAATTASPLRNDQNGIYDTITIVENNKIIFVTNEKLSYVVIPPK